MDRPNFVVFMPDQLRADAVGAFGNPVASTPNIDALAARGTLFRQAFSQHSVCSPSRVSMLTGWYPHVSGHRSLTHLIKPWEPNLMKMLRDGGYNVAWAGMRGDTFAPGVVEESTDFHGFMVPPTLLGSRSPYEPGHKFADAFYDGLRKSDGVVLDFDEATVQTAESWLSNSPKEPWLLFVALMFPHPPFVVEEPWFSLHDRGAMPEPTPPELDGKPRFMRKIRDRYGTERLDAGDWAELIATYYGMVSRIDDQLGRVVTAVEQAGVAERTATLFFTDHGEYLGDFGLVEKWPSGLDDCLLRNPLIIATPGGAPGQDCHSLVEMVDLLPTILELAEIEPGHTHFGRSLIPLLSDASLGHRGAAFSEGGFALNELDLLERPSGRYRHKGALQREDPRLVGKAVSIRTQRWTYIHRLYEANELYNRENDPRETTNLAGDAEVAEIERSLREQVLDWMLATADTIPWQEDPRFDPKLVDIIRSAQNSEGR